MYSNNKKNKLKVNSIIVNPQKLRNQLNEKIKQNEIKHALELIYTKKIY